MRTTKQKLVLYEDGAAAKPGETDFTAFAVTNGLAAYTWGHAEDNAARFHHATYFAVQSSTTAIASGELRTIS